MACFGLLSDSIERRRFLFLRDTLQERMAPERWQRIGDLVEQVLVLPPDEHTAFLEQACADDLDLRR